MFLQVFLLTTTVTATEPLEIKYSNVVKLKIEKKEPIKEFLFIGNVSAYTAGVESTGKSPSHPQYGLTASGERVRRGIVAADTRILPFGTKIHIEGYGDFVVKDTGDAVEGNCIDIYMEDVGEAIRFGRRNLKVYIYK